MVFLVNEFLEFVHTMKSLGQNCFASLENLRDFTVSQALKNSSSKTSNFWNHLTKQMSDILKKFEITSLGKFCENF